MRFLKGNQPPSILFSLCGDKNKASSRVRGFWIAEVLEAQGVQCTMRWKQGKPALLRFAFEILRHDVVIFQKTYSRYHLYLLIFAQRMGKITCVDLDDAPSRAQSPRTLNNIQAMMRRADRVFVGSQSLLSYAKIWQPDSRLLPSSIRLGNYQPRAEAACENAAPVVLGWIGNGRHYSKDLVSILRAPLTRIATENSVCLKLVGACGDRDLHESFSNIPNLKVELIDTLDWSDSKVISQQLQTFDIGLYPLLPNDFNEFKCGFKALEYMAMGVPVIASPVAVNAAIIDNNVDGLLAETSDDWVDALSLLINDKQCRDEFGKNGRQKVEKDFDVQQTAMKLLSVLHSKEKGE